MVTRARWRSIREWEPGYLPARGDVVLWLGFFAGAVMLTVAYAYAASHLTGQAHFHLFWLGMALFFVPACLRLCAPATPRAERLVILASLSLFDSLPKFLRSPHHLLFFDELAHYRQSELAVATGRLFQPNPSVPIVQYFPGLHALTAMLSALSGLDTFQLAVVLLVGLHVLALIGVFVLGEAIARSAKVASVAALVYSLNPGFLYFDAQYAYESLAIVFFIWAAVALLKLQEMPERTQQGGWFCVALLLGGACLVTHHATSYLLVLLAALMSAVGLARLRHGTERAEHVLPLVAFSLCLLASVIGWTAAEAPSIAHYLGPPARAVATGALEVLRPSTHHRTLFSGSTTPEYEHFAAFLTPALTAVGTVLGMWLLRRERRRRSSASSGVLLFGLLYFASLPLMLTQGGQEAARRSWSFSYLGLAPVLAIAVGWLLRRAGRQPPRAGIWLRTAVTALLGSMLVGNAAMTTNEVYRFPGAVAYGTDTRTLTPELLSTVGWFRTTMGAGQLVIADRDDAIAFASFGDAWTATGWSGLPIWQLYLSTQPPAESLLNTLRRDHYQYLVIDRDIAQYLPRIGYYIAADEPLSRVRVRPAPAPALSRYERLPWAIKVYQSDHLEIYRLNFDALSLTSPPRSHAGIARADGVPADAGSAPTSTRATRRSGRPHAALTQIAR